MRLFVPYDKKTIPIEIDDQNFVGSLVSRVESYQPGKTPEQLVEASLDHPIGTPKLEELAKGKKNIVIINSDHTRPVPSKIITPIRSQPDSIVPRPNRNVQPDLPHGAIVFSDDLAYRKRWIPGQRTPVEISEFAFVGVPMRKI
jgi:Lactate racemase N-terminal domain